MQNLTGDIHHFYTEKGAGFLCSRYPRTRKNTTRECAIYYPPVCRRSAPLHGPAPHKKGAYARVLGRRQYCACFCPAAPERVDRVILKPSTASFWIFYTRQGSTEKKEQRYGSRSEETELVKKELPEEKDSPFFI